MGQKTKHVYQVKLNNYEASDYKEMQKNYREYMKKQDISATNSKDLKIFLNQNYERLKQLKPNFLSVSKGKTNNHNININDIYENFFKLKLFPSTQNQLILEIEIEERINDDGNVFPNYASIGEEQYFLYVNANKLVLGLKEMFGPFSLENKQKLFYENVRGVLSKNINMSETIENEAKNFSKYNNGISITGSVTNTDSTFIINNPVVVNGQQTVYTLLEFKNESNLLKKVNVPVFIKNVSDPVEKGKIAHYNNSQRAIKAIDLLSINKNIRELQKTIYDLTKGNCYLNIYSSGRVEYHEFSKKIIENNNIIPLSDFIKLYYTILEPKNIGDWKNRISFSIENHMLSIKDEYKFDANIILEVIDVLDLYRNIFEDNKDKISDLKVADLAIQYMLHYYKHDKDAVLKTMEIINEDNFNGLTPENRKYSSIAAIYKNKHTYTHIEDAIKKYELILNNQNKNNSKD